MYDWYLEGHLDHHKTMRKLRVRPFPFIIGRKPGLPLSIDSENISRQHAKIVQEKDKLVLLDLKSTNGTFVNHHPVKTATTLKQGDIIHISNIELRLSYEPTLQASEDDSTLNIGGSVNKLPVGWLELEELLTSSLVTSEFQTLYHSHDESPFAFEILGRGTHAKLPRSPVELFRIAEMVKSEIALVELLRDDGVKRAASAASALPFFINIHPGELNDVDRLFRSVKKVRREFPKLRLILEIHEQAVSNLKVMRTLREELNQLGIGIAYDDFGTGQTRLSELAEIPPDYLKFDITLIKNINKVTARKEMVATFLSICKKMNIKTVAEGVSNQQEAATCRALSFDYLQGYYYERPGPKPEARFRKDTNTT